MHSMHDAVADKKAGAKPRRSRLRGIAGSRDGAAAIEFAVLAIPYFMLVFAIIETFVAYAGEQLVTNAMETMSRKLRTGEITYAMSRDTDRSEAQFRREFCDDISILIKCSPTEIITAQKLYIDVRSFERFALIPKTIPRVSASTYADIDTSAFRYSPGGPGSINMMRVFYRWRVITDLIRPYITTIRPSDGSMPSDFLIIAATAFQNEAY